MWQSLRRGWYVGGEDFRVEPEAKAELTELAQYILLEIASKHLRPNIIPPPPSRLPSKKWRDIILQVWHTDPLRCPVCQNLMRVIAVIDDRRVVEKILRHLGLWTEPQPLPQARPPPGTSGLWTYEPCLDVDPPPDYENVLTD